jgi:hypothetical protein
VTRRQLRAQTPPETGLRARATRALLAVLRRFSDAVDWVADRLEPVWEEEGAR